MGKLMYNEAELDFLSVLQIAFMQLQAISIAQHSLITATEEIRNQQKNLSPEQIELFRQKFPMVFEYLESLEETQPEENKNTLDNDS